MCIRGVHAEEVNTLALRNTLSARSALDTWYYYMSSLLLCRVLQLQISKQ